MHHDGRTAAVLVLRRAAIAASWAACLLQLLTSRPNGPSTLLEPLTPEWLAVLAAFLLTSAVWAVRPTAPFFMAHLSVVAFLFLLHPLSSVFGRDGALAAIALYGAALIFSRPHIRQEVKLLIASLLAAVFMLESALNLLPERMQPRPGLLDFGDLLGPCQAGGCLKPNLDVKIVAERGEGRFTSERHGFRSTVPILAQRKPHLRRVMLLGDSFVAGYRMDQDDTLGRRLELELSRMLGSTEVLAAQVPHPEAARLYIETSAAQFQPDLIIVGVTLGNDLAQTWAVRRRVPEPVIASLLLPSDAFDNSRVHGVVAKVERSARAWRSYRRLSRALRAAAITTDYADSPGSVHVFDSMNGVGVFYSRRSLPLLQQCFGELHATFLGLAAAAHDRGIPVLVAAFPQRYQVSPAEWTATVGEYRLDASAFDLSQPNSQLAIACARAGLRLFDLLPVFRADPEGTYLPLGDMHWSARGYELAGRALAREAADFLTTREMHRVSEERADGIRR